MTATSTERPGTEALALSSVLLNSLPATLATGEAPDRYEVEVIFTRRPAGEEIQRIKGKQTRTALGKQGYPDVVLDVADRRLIVSNTSLDELRDGLAGVLARRIDQICTELKQDQDSAVARAHDAAEAERNRAAKVAALATEISFDPRAHDTKASAANRAAGDESDRDDTLSAWASEGGGRG